MLETLFISSKNF